MPLFTALQAADFRQHLAFLQVAPLLPERSPLDKPRLPTFMQGTAFSFTLQR